MENLRRSLPTDPRVKDYTSALFAFNEYLDVDLDSAIIGVIPGDGGVARYVYDLKLIYRAYARSYGIEYDSNDPEDKIHWPAGKTREQILDEIQDNVFRHDWGNLEGGLEPILVADPSMSEAELEEEDGDEESSPMIFNGREYRLVR